MCLYLCHTYFHTYKQIHTYIHRYMHTYIHTLFTYRVTLYTLVHCYIIYLFVVVFSSLSFAYRVTQYTLVQCKPETWYAIYYLTLCVYLCYIRTYTRYVCLLWHMLHLNDINHHYTPYVYTYAHIEKFSKITSGFHRWYMYRQSISNQLFQRSPYNTDILLIFFIILGSTGGTCTLVGSQIVANNLHYTRTSYIQIFKIYFRVPFLAYMCHGTCPPILAICLRTLTKQFYKNFVFVKNH